MTHDEIQRWLDRYVEAWKSYDPDAIAALFAEDVEYHYAPSDAGIRGRAALVADWLAPNGDPAKRDVPGTFDAHYRPWAVEGARAVAVGTSDYFTDAGRTTVERRYHNVFLLEFDDAGRCRWFTESYVKAS